VEEGYQVLFERHGRKFGRAVETLTGRMPTPDEAQTLELADEVPVVHVLRTSYDVAKQHIHMLESLCAADKHVLLIRQPEGTDAF
jgi:DNA-binding GntR family transcriptional regulator